MAEQNFNFTETGYTPGDTDFNFGVTAGSYNYVLKGATNNFTSIWADPNASLTSGKFYIAGSNIVQTLDSATPSVYDYYTSTVPGRAQETLEDTDIVDMGVGYGV